MKITKWLTQRNNLCMKKETLQIWLIREWNNPKIGKIIEMLSQWTKSKITIFCSIQTGKRAIPREIDQKILEILQTNTHSAFEKKSVLNDIYLSFFWLFFIFILIRWFCFDRCFLGWIIACRENTYF